MPATKGLASATEANPAPAKMVGKWTRKVTAADVKRAGTPYIPAGSVWTLTVKKSGYASLSGKDQGEPFTGNIVPAGANRVHMNIGVRLPNVYRWRVSGRLLTLTKISDPVLTERVAVLWGVWKRK